MEKIRSVADCLYLVRVTQRLTQEEVAKIAGCSGAMIHTIEKGKRIPSIKMIVKIAKALCITQETISLCAADDLKDEIEKQWDSE